MQQIGQWEIGGSRPGQAQVKFWSFYGHTKLILCFTDPARSFFYFILLATNVRRPGNEAKYSPRGKMEDGEQFVWPSGI